MREYTGAACCLAATSCTTGLDMALRALGIGPGDEVAVPDYTYPATATVVRLLGASATLVDVDPRTMLVDYDALEAAITPATKAVMPVSLFGNPLDWDRLDDIRRRRGVFLIEDAACALGSSYKGRRTGILADITVFSLHPRKTVTTGEGGPGAHPESRTGALDGLLQALRHGPHARGAARRGLRAHGNQLQVERHPGPPWACPRWRSWTACWPNAGIWPAATRRCWPAVPAWSCP